VTRLDETLVARSLSPSRSRARDMVLRGSVSVNGVTARKPAKSIAATDVITVHDSAQAYVSRAALKLIHALDHFKLSPAGRQCLDIGASAGGFTQVLLERGAAHVIALDVGHGQLVSVLAGDSRVTSLEGTNSRGYSVPDAIAFVTADVSFISLKLALGSVLDQAVSGTKLVALIKPQFEVGRGRLPRDGVVKDADLHAAVQADISRFVESAGWRVLGIIDSPIEGGDGNREFLLAATKP
jgi:23S rRNA (cytidine1920-2'-O)/16S rRNA (cytidine1409-2'-O)-methyltransferase